MRRVFTNKALSRSCALCYLPSVVGQIPIFIQFKIWVTNLFPLHADSLHLYGGILFLLATLLLFRHRQPSWWMCLPGALISVAVEIGDLYFDWATQIALRWDHSIHDLWNTNFLPAVLILFLRLRFGGFGLPDLDRNPDESHKKPAAQLVD